MTDDRVRAFVAIPLPEEIRRALAAEQRSLGGELPGVRWANPRSMHVTLRFIGDVEATLIPQLGQALGQQCEPLPPFELNVAGLGVFPNVRRPRVLWAGIDDHPDLQRLYRACARAMQDCGDPGEPVKFSEYRPHLTLGRFKQRPERQRLSLLRSRLTSEGRQYGVIEVTEAHLYRSELLPSGARYEVLASAHLRG